MTQWTKLAKNYRFSYRADNLRSRIEPPSQKALWRAPILFLLAIFFSVHTTTAHAEQFSVIPSGISLSISQPTISAIHKDKNGFLWIGTQEGLYKFYGRDFDRFDSKSAGQNFLPSSDIRGIIEDRQNRIIVATFGSGLLRWEPLAGQFVQVNQGYDPAHAKPTDIFRTKSGNIIVASKDHVHIYDEHLGTELEWATHNGILDKINGVTSYTELESGDVILGSMEGLVRVSFDAKVVRKIAIQDQELNVSALSKSSKGYLIVGTDSGSLHEIDVEKRKVLKSLDLGSDHPTRINSLLIIGEHLYVAMNRGILITNLDFSTYTFLGENNSELSNNYVTKTFYDGDRIWLGTFQGLDLISRRPVELFNKANSGITPDILAFSEDDKRTVWIGSYEGLYFLEEGSSDHIRLKTSELADQRVMTIASKENKVWVGFWRNGVQIITRNLTEHSLARLENTANLNVTKILHASDGTTWIGSYNQGLHLYSDGGLSQVDSIPHQSVTIVFEHSSNELIASTEQSIHLRREESQDFDELDLSFDAIAKTPIILTVAESPTGEYLIGTKDHGIFVTSGGLDRNRVNILKPLAYSPELSRLTVYGIIVDDNDNLWCSTQNGIFKLSLRGDLLLKLNPSDGLQSKDFNFGAYYQDSSGRIYFGGVSGYNRFYPEEINQISTPSPLVLTGLQISGLSNIRYRQLESIDHITLSHRNDSVTATFNVLDYLAPQATKYRYMLSGFHQSWIDNGAKNSITYMNLPPGNYSLHAQGANSAGVWNLEGVSIEITVLPPPWRTWWAYCFYALALVAVLYMIKRYYDNHVIKERAVEMAQEMYAAADRAEDDLQEQEQLQDELVGSMHQFNLSTLELVKQCLEHGKHPDEELELKALSQVESLQSLDHCLYYQDGVLLADLRKYVDSITPGLLASATVPASTITLINMVSEQKLPAALAGPLSMIIHQLLQLILANAFEPESLANYIQVSLDPLRSSKDAGVSYMVKVEDDGTAWPQDISDHRFSLIRALVDTLEGSISYTRNQGNLFELTLPGESAPGFTSGGRSV